MNALLKKIGLFVAATTLCVGVAAEGKVRSFDLSRALSSSKFAHQQFKLMEADASFKSVTAKMKSLKSELQGLQKEGETKSLTWSEEQKKQHIQKMQEKLNILNQAANQQATMRKRVEENIARELTPKIESATNAIIEEQGIDMLVRAPAVHFRKPEFDITQLVIERLNSAK